MQPILSSLSCISFLVFPIPPLVLQNKSDQHNATTLSFCGGLEHKKVNKYLYFFFRELRNTIRNAASLTPAAYDAEMTSLLKSSVALDTTYASDCLTEKGLGFYVPETAG